ncbi:sensor histidine kinase [Emticicia sp. BO119]|uniref:sensor histidine kinase n=1 Tax=Emticicia sp. BO119 TaxID=2757768 RepID=UPI0015F111EF|nr:histidine kinase [Emticicia sp. BO119]MBA4849146.1 histidine kinase [Emticicia sp. BO119]
MNKNKLYWFFQIVGWSLYNINEIFQYTLQFGYDSSMISNALANTVLSIILTHLFRLVVKRFNWGVLHLPQLAIRVGLSVFAMTVILVALNVPLDVKYVGELLNEKPVLVIEYFINLAKPILVWALIYMFYNYSEERRQREVEEIKLKSSIKETEAKVLRAQMNPHFMFNALNSIRALVLEDPTRAQQGITQLSNILRSSLLADRRKTVALKEELRTIEDYLALEKVRYEERLQMKWDIAPETQNIQVPPMMLQTLVENAIKHGVQKAINWGFVEINTSITDNKLYIKIRNTGQLQGTESKSESGGFGLKNTAQRLDLLYGSEASFKIYQEDSLTVCAEIMIPLSSAEARSVSETKNAAPALTAN